MASTVISSFQLGNTAENCYTPPSSPVLQWVMTLFFDRQGDFCEKCGQTSIVQSLSSTSMEALKEKSCSSLMRQSILGMLLG